MVPKAPSQQRKKNQLKKRLSRRYSEDSTLVHHGDATPLPSGDEKRGASGKTAFLHDGGSLEQMIKIEPADIFTDYPARRNGNWFSGIRPDQDIQEEMQE